MKITRWENKSNLKTIKTITWFVRAASVYMPFISINHCQKVKKNGQNARGKSENESQNEKDIAIQHINSK